MPGALRSYPIPILDLRLHCPLFLADRDSEIAQEMRRLRTSQASLSERDRGELRDREGIEQGGELSPRQDSARARSAQKLDRRATARLRDGGERGSRKRKMKPDWKDGLDSYCRAGTVGLC